MKMARIGGSIAILLGLVAWLVLSYWPAAAALTPAIAFDGGWAATWLPALAAAVVAASLAVQGWLVYATAQAVRPPADAAQAAVVRQFHLDVGVEALLTAAPLVITLAVAALVVYAAR